MIDTPNEKPIGPYTPEGRELVQVLSAGTRSLVDDHVKERTKDTEVGDKRLEAEALLIGELTELVDISIRAGVPRTLVRG